MASSTVREATTATMAMASAAPADLSDLASRGGAQERWQFQLSMKTGAPGRA